MNMIKKIAIALSISLLIITNSFAGSPGDHIVALIPIKDAKKYTEKFNVLFDQLLSGKEFSCVIKSEKSYLDISGYSEQSIKESEYPNILKDKKLLKEFRRRMSAITTKTQYGFDVQFDSYLFYEINKDNLVLTGVSFAPGTPTIKSEVPISEMADDILLSNAICNTLVPLPVRFDD